MHDIVVIGGGPGGYAAAIKARQLGASVALVEGADLGGTCLNQGCIPTKALVQCAHLFSDIKGAASFGILTSPPKADWATIQQRTRRVVETSRKGLAMLIKSYGIEVVKGWGRLASRDTVIVSTPEGEIKLTAGKGIILAPGSEPVELQCLPFDGEVIISSDKGIFLPNLPSSLIVVGGGVIGCELACIYASFGVEVTLVELLPSLLPMVDAEIVKHFARSLRKRKVKVLTGSSLVEGKIEGSAFVGVLNDGKELRADKCLVVVGRRPRTADIALDSAGLALNRSAIAVDDYCATNLPGVWAVGDATGRWMLAHSAYLMAETATKNALGARKSIKDAVIPNCIFTHPEIGTVGLTEEEASEQFSEITVGRYLYRPLGRAQAAGKLDGLFKLIANAQTCRIVGAHIIGEGATDLVAEATLAIRNGLTLQDIAHTVHSHPTYSEGLHEAACATLGISLHSPPAGK